MTRLSAPCIGLALVTLVSTEAQTNLPLVAPCFGPNMVLRQPRPTERTAVVLWGWAPSRQHVSVEFPGTRLLRAELRTDDRLRARKLDLKVWVLKADDLPGPLPTTGPFSLTIRLHKSRPGDALKNRADVLAEQELTNVVVGEVWLLQVRPNRGVPHSVAELPPAVRVLPVSPLVWDGRAPELLERVGQTGWRIPGSDQQALQALPSLVAYTAQHRFRSGPQTSLPLGIIVVEQDPPEERKPSRVNDSSPMASAVYAAYTRCQEDEAMSERERLLRKRRGLATGGFASRLPVARVDRRQPPAGTEFFYDVNGFFW